MENSLITQARTQFGLRVRQLRQQQGLTLVELAGRTAVSEPALVAVEHGRRAVGESLTNRLASALGIRDKELEDFQFAAVATRKEQRFQGSVGLLPPEITHFAPKRLESEGIALPDIERAELGREVGRFICPWKLSELRRVIGQWEQELKVIREELLSGVPASHPLLHIWHGNGDRRLAVMLMSGIS